MLAALLLIIGSPGLATDNPQLHPDRIKLWNEFNYAWLALLQKQKDIASSKIELQEEQTLVSKETLETMGNEIVQLCDGIKVLGLVDYEYGVWEESIIEGMLSLQVELTPRLVSLS